MVHRSGTKLSLTRLSMMLVCFATGLALLHGQDRQEAKPGSANPAALPVTEGLACWLDAGRLNIQRQTLGVAAVADGGQVDLWPDASGRKQHLTQKTPAAQPRLLTLPGISLVRFDGLATYLVSQKPGRVCEDLTVFVVAAPQSNPGMFAALLGASATGKNDYQAGFNLDQGGAPSTRFATMNLEGAGMNGQSNLLRKPAEFGALQRLCVTTSQRDKTSTLHINSQSQGTRRRDEQRINLEELVLGARYYNNFGPPQVCGFGEVDIAEVILYDRTLTAEERAKVDDYLTIKYCHVVTIPSAARAGKPLTRVANPPPVQMLLPGFTVRELPVQLPNVNNVLYRPDGKLVALGYNGNVYLLADTNGDGLEDKVELFWKNPGTLRSPIGLALTPPNYPKGWGVFVASKGKCSLLLDKNRDDQADEELVLASGWKELPHGVDALGIAVNPKDHSIYFGLGTHDYEDPYGVHKKDVTPYSLKSERGTILRIDPNTKSREIIATGIRFPVGLRFNRHGDLFCTDQEGATWLPNGNPFDELLHIEKGKHYGFPPRHPKHLPKVIDEPSVVDFAPQHQSTCGLAFNEPVNGGPTFGPAHWKDDVFIAGYSRGKLYRVKLIKTPTGYVAQNQIIACLNRLTCDVCVSPQGDLIVATHSGGPDWGDGPTGAGKLYKISYTGKDVAQPVLVWTQSPQEVRVAFDRALSQGQIAAFAKGVSIEHGRYVAAGDRFESLWPGYKVVQDQQRTPRYELPIYSTQVSADGRTLILATAPHQAAHQYALTLPDVSRQGPPPPGTLPQMATLDLQYSLQGVQATWRSNTTRLTWSGWLPHIIPVIAREMTQGSATHESLWTDFKSRDGGTLKLRTMLDLHDVLRPAVQPGSRLDHDWPSDEVTFTFPKLHTYHLQLGGQKRFYHVNFGPDPNRFVNVDSGKLVPLEIEYGASQDHYHPITWHTTEDPRPRPLPHHRMLLPWAPTSEEAPPVVAIARPELAGGNWERGRQVFHSEQAACAKCHRFRGEGQKIGPDLSNLPHRDYDSVLRDVTEPSYAINPDFVTQVVSLHDGRVLTGALRTEGDQLHIANEKGEVTTVHKTAVEAMQPSKKSVMPEDLPKLLGPEKLRDLLTYLLTEEPRMPDYGRGQPPEPRSRKEVDAVLAGAPTTPAKLKPLHIVLVAGRKDHGPGEHDYPAWQKVWKQLLSMADATTVSTADEWPTAKQIETADVLVFYQQGKWTPERARDMDFFFARGCGAVYIHYAVDGGADAPGFAKRIGLAWRGNHSRFRHGWLDLGFESGKDHPVARNFDQLRLHDESYWRLDGDPQRVKVLATGKEDGEPQPLFWTLEPIKGRVFVSIPGHFAWTFDDPLFRVVLLRGIAWSAHEPVDRFNALVLPGARVR